MPITQLVRILDADPDLAGTLRGEQRELARRSIVAEVVAIGQGENLSAAVSTVDSKDPLGLLVLDGLALRRVRLVGRAGVEIIGAGDLIRPWQFDGDTLSVAAYVEWTVCETTRVAILDEDVQTLLARFPSVLRELVGRLVQRSNALALNLAIAQLPRIDARLHVLFWHLADRFGRVESDGVVVPLRLSHATLADLVFARRQSVTTALGQLARQGLLSRESPARWVLSGEPPAEALPSAARFARSGDAGTER